MAPQKESATLALKPVTNKMTTRLSSRTSVTANMLKKMHLKDLTKRKADQLSPPKGKDTKRSVFLDLTNATGKENISQKKTLTLKKEIVKVSTIAQPKCPTFMKITSRNTTSKTASLCNQENIKPTIKTKITIKNTETTIKKEVKAPTKVETQIKVQQVSELVVKKPEIRSKVSDTKCKDDEVKEKTELPLKSNEENTNGIKGRKSDTDESSLYASALDTFGSPTGDDTILIFTPEKKERKKHLSPVIPVGVDDFDKENWDDPCQVSEYAMDVFKYLKSRESMFEVADYLPKQTAINKWMRAVLVDWMVDVQEHFELCHETLYLAVKVMDLYLDKKIVAKESLQLVGVASLFISSKYDERIPPTIEEFLYMCENTYNKAELLRMEIELFKSVDFCLGMPLSYRFLRRFARCSKTTMPVLTLARYILELALMEYQFIFTSESKIACASLYLALVMKGVSGWTETLKYYSGYEKKDFLDISLQLNAMLHRKPKEQLRTVRNKYSHAVFFEVAKTPMVENEVL